MIVLAPHLACLITSAQIMSEDGKTETNEIDQAIEAGYKQIYVATPQGVFYYQILKPGKQGKTRYICTKVDKVPGVRLREPKEMVEFLPDGKIPYRLLEEVKAFFRQVIEKKKTAVEAMIWILWEESKGYYLHVPNQTVSKASATYDWSGLPAGAQIIVDIHSHADFGAFFSGTDDRDDSGSIRFSGVIGHNHTPNPTSTWRFNAGAKKIPATIEDIFVHQGYEVSVPESWLNAVNTSIPTLTSVSTTKYRNGGSPGYNLPSGFHGGWRSEGRQAELEGVEAEGSGFVHRKGKEKKDEGAGNLPSTGSVKNGGAVYLDIGGGLIEVPPSYSNRPDIIQTPSEELDPGNKLWSQVLAREISYQEYKDEIQHRRQKAQQPQQSTQSTSEDPSSPKASPGLSSLNRPGKSFTSDRDEDDAIRAAYDHMEAMFAKRMLVEGSDSEEEASERPADTDGEESTGSIEFHNLVSERELDPVLCANHGVQAAAKFFVASEAIAGLITQPRLLREHVSDTFLLLEEEEQFKLFKDLYEYLPEVTKEKLASSGF